MRHIAPRWSSYFFDINADADLRFLDPGVSYGVSRCEKSDRDEKVSRSERVGGIVEFVEVVRPFFTLAWLFKAKLPPS